MSAAVPAWRERISTRDLKTFSDVFAGDKRTARAIESAVRKNIEGAFRSLDQSLVGDLLTDVYLQTKKSLELQSQGGARVKVKAVHLEKADFQ